jgi:hypothetical protein
VRAEVVWKALFVATREERTGKAGKRESVVLQIGMETRVNFATGETLGDSVWACLECQPMLRTSLGEWRESESSSSLAVWTPSNLHPRPTRSLLLRNSPRSFP